MMKQMLCTILYKLLVQLWVDISYLSQFYRCFTKLCCCSWASSPTRTWSTTHCARSLMKFSISIWFQPCSSASQMQMWEQHVDSLSDQGYFTGFMAKLSLCGFLLGTLVLVWAENLLWDQRRAISRQDLLTSAVQEHLHPSSFYLLSWELCADLAPPVASVFPVGEIPCRPPALTSGGRAKSRGEEVLEP